MNRERKISDLYESVKSISERDAFRRVIEGETDVNVLADLRDRFWSGIGDKPWQVKEINRHLTNPPAPAVGSNQSEQTSALAADKLTLLDHFARLPIGQLWGFIGIVAGLFVAASGIVWTVRGAVEDTKIQAAIAKADDLNRRLAAAEREKTAEADKARQLRESTEKERGVQTERLHQLQEKDRFLSLYLRFVMSRDKLDTSISYEAARKALDDYIEGRVDRDRLVIHKGGGRLATVEFFDGTVWTLPNELHIVEKP